MKILALDCSSEACSVALLSDTAAASPEIHSLFELAPRQHTQRLLPLVEQLLAEHETSITQLDAIAFGRGPGSFTGLRICLGAVQGLAYGADLPVLPVSTLAAQAQHYISSTAGMSDYSGLLVSTLDARMDEIYWGVYQLQGSTVQSLGNERLTAPEQLSLSDSGAEASQQLSASMIIGSGLNYAPRIPHIDQFTAQHAEALPTASGVAKLAHIDFLQGRSCRADQALPVYLRDEVAWQKQSPVL